MQVDGSVFCTSVLWLKTKFAVCIFNNLKQNPSRFCPWSILKCFIFNFTTLSVSQSCGGGDGEERQPDGLGTTVSEPLRTWERKEQWCHHHIHPRGLNNNSLRTLDADGGREGGSLVYSLSVVVWVLSTHMLMLKWLPTHTIVEWWEF